ncbi:MAG: pectate lyase [Prevotella sp.]|nr:pectate lyase [Prevotella sp.]
MKRILSLFTLALALTAQAQQEQTPAFPGAEGFGRYVTGGRGGKVLHVKNLNDSGYQSLRWCLQQQGAKTIVFDISGTIHLESSLSIPSNTTIAGQTAPGDGICIADYPVSISGNNVIVRYMRFRLGNKNVKKDGADGWDGFGGFDKQDWMIDHCSVSWSIDECLSVLGNKSTTVQWCLVAQSLVNSGHSKGAHGYGGNWGGSGASFHHNLIAHHTSRTPRLGPRPTTQLDERMDMRNNVIYNFGNNGCYGGEGMTVNIVNNYYKPGPGSPTNDKGKRIAGIGIRTNSYVAEYPAYAPALHLWGKYYVTGNKNSKYSDVTANNWQIGIINQVNASDCDGTWTQATRDSIKLSEPMPFIYTTTHTADMAYERVLSYVGCSKSRDSFDEMMISDTRNGKASHTGTGLGSGFINTQDDNKPAGAGSDWSAWPTLNSTEAPVDTDGDGMPDDWETAHGLNPSNKNDGNALNDEGYTMLEVYLNSLVADITAAQNEGGEPQGKVINVGESQYSSYDISGQTSNGDWTFSGGFKMNQTGTPATGNYGTIKYSANRQYKLTLPAGLTFSRVDFYGYANADGGSSYLSEVNGTTYNADAYPFPARDATPGSITHSISFEEPFSGTFSFTPKGSQTCLILTLHVSQPTGIIKVENSETDNVRFDDAVYSLDGRRVTTTKKGIYIIGGRKKVVL